MQQNMEYILTIYECGSIRKAAKRLRVTQPALSIALRKVEEKLGSPLFDRNCHPLELTPAGKIYLEGIHQMQQIEKNVQTAISDLSHLNSGDLNIGGTQYFTSYILPPVIRRYMQLYPGVNLRLSEAGTAQNIRYLLDNQLDLILSTRDYPSDRFALYPLACNLLLLCVPLTFVQEFHLQPWELSQEDVLSGRYRLAEPLTDLSLLARLPFISLSPESDMYKRSAAFFQEASICPQIVLQVEQLVTAYHLSCCQIGATFVTDALVRKSARADVRYFRLDTAFASRAFHIVTRKNHYLSNAAQKFIALCRQELQFP